jgi:hypothetical protein
MQEINAKTIGNDTTATPFSPLDGSEDLYVAPGGLPVVKDTTAATWAGLSQPRGIRRTIAGLVAAGLIQCVDSAAAYEEQHERPIAFRAVESTSRGTRGAKQRIAVFYLDQRAAEIVVMKLRAPGAADAKQRIAEAFTAAKTSPPALPPAPSAPAQPSLPAVEPGDHVGRILDMARGLPAGPDRDALLLGAAAMISPASRAPLALPPHVEPVADPLAAARARGAAAPPGLKLPPVYDHGQEAEEGKPVDSAALEMPPRSSPDVAPKAGEWLSPGRLAVRLTVATGREVHPQNVGRALTALGFRDRPELFHEEVVERSHTDGEAIVQRWAPSIWGSLLGYFQALAAGPATRKAKPRKASATTAPAATREEQPVDTRARAGDVLAAIRAQDPAALAPLAAPKHKPKPARHFAAA